MNKDFKNLKKYFNENGLRFNLNEERIWNYIEEVFGRKRAEKLSNIFDDQYYNLNDEKVDVKYKFCNNFEEATTLMYFQSDWFLKKFPDYSRRFIKGTTKNDIRTWMLYWNFL